MDDSKTRLTTTSSAYVTVTEPPHGWVSLNLRELWNHRELLYFLVLRSIKIRYKQTVLGMTWAVIQPLMTMVVFSIFFGGLARIPSDGVPYPIFCFTALVPWTFFASGLTNSTGSLVGGAGMVKKIYFPRLILPLSAIFAGVVDFVLAFLVLVGMIVYFITTTPLPVIIQLERLGLFRAIDINLSYGINPTTNVIWLPFLLLLALVTSLGVGLWLTALNVQFRDVRYIVGFLTRLWLFVTPITYPSSLLDEQWRLIYALNPMTGVVEGFRWALLDTDTAPGPMILVSAAVAFALLVSGAFYFRRMEKIFADVI